MTGQNKYAWSGCANERLIRSHVSVDGEILSSDACATIEARTNLFFFSSEVFLHLRAQDLPLPESDLEKNKTACAREGKKIPMA